MTASLGEMTVDVVVVSYRSGTKIASCLTAARRFLGDRAQLIVVDNSPGDGAAESAIGLHPDLRLIENAANIGFAAAVNRGIATGSGDIVLLLNPDVADIHGERALVESAFLGDSRVAAVSPRLLNPDGSVQHSARREPNATDVFFAAFGARRLAPGGWDARRYLDEWDYTTSRVVDTVFGACLFLRRAALADVGLLDERFFLYGEETDWLVRAKRRGWKTLFLADVNAIHHLRSSTDASEPTLTLLLLESHYRYARKHFGSFEAALLRSAVALVDAFRLVLATVRGPRKAEHRRFLGRRMALHLLGTTDHPI